MLFLLGKHVACMIGKRSCNSSNHACHYRHSILYLHTWSLCAQVPLLSWLPCKMAFDSLCPRPRLPSLPMTPLRHQQQPRELTVAHVKNILAGQDCTEAEAAQVVRALKGGGHDESVSVSLSQIMKSDQFRKALMQRRRNARETKQSSPHSSDRAAE